MIISVYQEQCTSLGWEAGSSPWGPIRIYVWVVMFFGKDSRDNSTFLPSIPIDILCIISLSVPFLFDFSLLTLELLLAFLCNISVLTVFLFICLFVFAQIYQAIN